MKLFVSYAREDRSIALRVAQALEAEDHHVFIDQNDLHQGDVYNRRIREEIDDSDGFVFLISPDSVKRGRYTLSELEQAVRKWRPAHGHIFAFFARPTEEQLPDYLPATTIEHTEGDLPAKVAAAIASYSSGPPRKAKLLAAQKLVRAVRALDNGIRDHLAALSVFDSSWSTDHENDRIEKVVGFAKRSELIVDVRAAFNSLEPMIDWSSGEADELLSSYQLGKSYLYNLGGPDSPTPFKSESQMEDFFREIRNAETPDEVAAVKQWANDIMKVVEGGRIEREEEKCQKLLANLR